MCSRRQRDRQHILDALTEGGETGPAEPVREPAASSPLRDVRLPADDVGGVLADKTIAGVAAHGVAAQLDVAVRANPSRGSIVQRPLMLPVPRTLLRPTLVSGIVAGEMNIFFAGIVHAVGSARE